MQISEVRVKLVADPEEKLLAFCTITFDQEFVVRDVKIIRGPSAPFVAMPSRKLTDRCHHCGGKNHLRARHCNDCGRALDADRAGRDERGRAKLHTDIAHPIHAEARQQIQGQIIAAYTQELERSKQPGYTPPKLGADYDDEDEPIRRAPLRAAPPEREMEA